MKALILVLATLLAVSPVMAQHGGKKGGQRGGSNRGSEHQRGNEHQRGGVGHDRGDRKYDNHRGEHRRLHDRDFRYRGGRREVWFGGSWFGCSLWPNWVFAGDVYFEDINGEWYVISYRDPRLMQLVVVID